MRVSNETIQICYLCGRSSEDVEFSLNRTRLNGLNSSCKDCDRLRQRGRQRRPSEAQRRAVRRYYARNRETILRRRRERYASDEVYRERAKERARR